MNKPYVLFDVETEQIQGSLDLDKYIPNITVAATLTGDGDLRHWYEQDQEEKPVGGVLSASRAQALVRYLAEMEAAGYDIVTWNGAGFDFRVLAKSSALLRECVDLAWRHIDMMFWVHCVKGFAISLAKAADVAGSGKTAGMSGADAPRLWAEGQYERVLQYVAQDVRATAKVYQAALQQRGIRWRTGYGRVSKAAGKLLAVRDAFKLPQPDTSWMSRRPWPRTKFVGWMLAASAGE